MPVLLVAKGRDITTNRIIGSGTEPKFVAWGTDDGAILPLADGNAALGAAAPEARTTGTSSRQTTATANDTYRVVGTITAAAARAIKEAALFDALTAGNLFIRGTFAVINLEAADSIQFTIEGRYNAP